MKRLVHIAFGVFAVIGAAYTAILIYVSWFLPHCSLHYSAPARSPDDRHFAIFEQRSCEEPALSQGHVLIGASHRKERIVVVDILGTTDVRFTWNGDRRLTVSIPESANAKFHEYYPGWPRIVERRVPN